MSLQPLWHSTLFGVYFFAGGFVSSFGLLALLAYVAQRSAPPAPIGPSHFHALGRLMLGFTAFWGYCAFFQALLIQIADKPQEVTFYTDRLQAGWRSVTWLLVAVRLVIPFTLLLPRAIKLNPKAMALLGVLLITGEYLDVLWLVSPMQTATRAVINLWDMAALFAVASSAVAFAAWRLRGRPWVPLGDPKLARSIAYRSPL
jgi:Ni/Fe-hydrogenase subunit HybB-like protein